MTAPVLRVVLLRGLMREQGHWGSFPQALQASLAPCEVLTPDLPGNGVLWQQRSPCSIEAMMDAARLQVATAWGQTPGPVHVVALSLGGMVATSWASRYPSEVASLSLLSTSMRPFSPMTQRLKWQRWPRILGLLCQPGNIDKRERAVLQMTVHQPPADDLLESWLAIQQHHPVSARNALRQLWAAARFRAPTQRPAPPLLLLCGRNDALVDPRCSAAIARAWACPLQVHPEAGHDLPLDDPAWVIAQLRSHLR